MTFTKRQEYSNLPHQNAVDVFISSETFSNCFEELKKITQSVIINKLHLSKSTNTFKYCITVSEYFEMLEESLGIQQQYPENYISILNEFFTEVIARTSVSIQGIKRDYNKFLKTLRGNLQVSIENFHSGHKKKLSDLNNKISFRPTDTPKLHIKFDSGVTKATQKFIEAPNIPFILLDPERFYSINLTYKRGICVFINIFAKDPIIDFKPAKNTFEQLNYKFYDKKNITTQEYDEFIEEINDEIEELNSDSFVLIISSQGDQNSVIFSDGKTMDRADLIKKFAKNQSLLGKPKLFFFQNYSGLGGHIEATSKFDQLITDLISTNPITFKPNGSETNTTIPLDFLSISASTDGEVAANNESGSVFLKNLYDIILDHKQRRLPIKEILIELRSRVSADKLPAALNEDAMIGGFSIIDKLEKIFHFSHPYI